MKFRMKTKIELTALKTLFKEAGVLKTVRILPGIFIGKLKGGPWKTFPAPESKKDSESRQLIGDAIILYRILLRIFDIKEAERITREVITASSVVQLSCAVPIIERETIENYNDEEKERMFCGIIAKFPNADYEVIDSDRVYSFKITRCRLAELITEAGHPELRDAFCAGDGLYFRKYQPDLIFKRDCMIGKGDSCCLFEFKIKETENTKTSKDKG